MCRGKITHAEVLKFTRESDISYTVKRVLRDG